ncbi:MAG: glycosyltransferase [Candidatus Hodarchaeota archaeon]
MVNLPITIVIPVKNGRDTILMTLRSLMKQSQLPREVFVIDDCSTDGTWEILTAFKENNIFAFPLFLHRIQGGSKGPSHARNYGISRASSELIAFIDSDCVTVKNWLFHLTRPLLHPSCPPELAGTGGKIKTYWKNLLGEFFEMMSAYKNPSNLYFLVTANCCYKKEVLEEIGGFNESMYPGEDAEIGIRLVYRGYKFEYVPNAIVYNHFPSKIRDLIQKFLGYGAMDYLSYKTEKFIISKTKTFHKPSPFIKQGEMLLRQVNLRIMIHLIRKFTKMVLEVFQKNIYLLDAGEFQNKSPQNLPKTIIFIFFIFLARFSHLRGFIKEYCHDLSNTRN